MSPVDPILSERERGLLGLILEQASPQCASALLAQLHSATVTSRSPWNIELVVEGPRAACPDGPLTAEGLVTDEDGKPSGTLQVWLEDGRIAALEQSWFTDGPAPEWPDLARVTVVFPTG
jgi:hypothetical protein